MDTFSYHHHITYLYAICAVIRFFIGDVYEEFGLIINVHLFATYCLQFRLEKSEIFFMSGEWCPCILIWTEYVRSPSGYSAIASKEVRKLPNFPHMYI